MRYIIPLLVLFVSCTATEKPILFKEVIINDVFTDTLSIRAISLMGNSLAFAANNGAYGTVDLATHKVRFNQQKYDSILPEFRAIAHTANDFFMISVGNPALLYKTGDDGTMKLVYKEEGEGVFYDAMTFWNDAEGIAIGDTVDGCLSIIITRDGGNTWLKQSCELLPQGILGEGAFAASNTNISVVGDKTWVATTSSRVYFSEDKGSSWSVQETPIVKDEPTQGIYSIDFYDEFLGVAIGGDYTQPSNTSANKAITTDGGQTWRLLAPNAAPNYKSCIRFVPGTKGTGLVALGFTGIAYSGNSGKTWQKISDESFYTLRFKNDSVAYAAGKNRIAKLVFR